MSFGVVDNVADSDGNNGFDEILYKSKWEYRLIFLSNEMHACRIEF